MERASAAFRGLGVGHVVVTYRQRDDTKVCNTDQRFIVRTKLFNTRREPFCYLMHRDLGWYRDFAVIIRAVFLVGPKFEKLFAGRAGSHRLPDLETTNNQQNANDTRILCNTGA